MDDSLTPTTELEAAQLSSCVRLASGDETAVHQRGFHGKLFATETARNVAIRSVQMLGGYGYTKEYPVERYLRDV